MSKTAKFVMWSFIILMILGALALVYFKVVKPAIDKKKEADRLKETNTIQAAQAAPAPSQIIASEAAQDAPVKRGIGGEALYQKDIVLAPVS